MPKRINQDERRRVIASAAVEAIAADGLDGVKLSRIAREAGVTTGAVAHYFEDKDEVLLAALEEVRNRLLERMARPDDRPWFDQCADVLPVDDASRKEWRVWLAFWGRAAFVPAMARVHRAYYTEIEQTLADALGGDQDTARAIIAVIDGLSVRICLEPELWPAKRQRAALAAMLAPFVQETPHADASTSTA